MKVFFNMHYPPHLLRLIQVFKRLPGVGSKTAERFAFQLLEWPDLHREELSQTVSQVKEKIRKCDECGCLEEQHEPCFFCHSPKRDPSTLCVIASPRDIFAIEETREYSGLYHVIGGLLSPLDRRGPEMLSMGRLAERIKKNGVKELIIALDSTLEGDATALYIRKELEPYSLTITRLAFGLPIGSSLDYVDGGTLARALLGRNHF